MKKIIKYNYSHEISFRSFKNENDIFISNNINVNVLNSLSKKNGFSLILTE
jgi:hypothetical protein